jgi:hypothetical protein
MKPIKFNPVVTVYIIERGCALHILFELLEVPVKGPDQGPHVVHHLLARTYLVFEN